MKNCSDPYIGGLYLSPPPRTTVWVGWGTGAAKERPQELQWRVISPWAEGPGTQAPDLRKLSPSSAWRMSVPHSYHLLKPVEKPCHKQDAGHSQVNLPLQLKPFQKSFSKAHYTCGQFHTDLKRGNHTWTLFQYPRLIIQRDLRANNSVKQRAQ